METINREILKRLAIVLPTNVKGLLRTGELTVYDVLELLTGTLNSMAVNNDENTDALEEWTSSVADWASEWENKIVAYVNGNGESVPVSGVKRIDTFTDGEIRLSLSDGSSLSSVLPFANEVDVEDEESVHGGLMTQSEARQLQQLVDLGIGIDTRNNILSIGGKSYYLSDKKSSDVTVLDVTYGTPKITLEYADKIPAAGGTIGYSKFICEQDVVTTYSDGSTKTSTNTKVDKAVFSGSNVDSEGNVTAVSSTSATQRAYSVTVTVTMNGKSAQKTVTAYQAAYTGNVTSQVYYVGSMDATATEFENKSAAELTTGVTAYEVGKNNTTHSIDTCFYMLLPVGMRVSKCKYSSGGLTTDINGNSLWNIHHGNIIYGGKTYGVYGYRSGVIDENNAIDFEHSAAVSFTVDGERNETIG